MIGNFSLPIGAVGFSLFGVKQHVEMALAAKLGRNRCQKN
jgi:hypothetical protein